MRPSPLIPSGGVCAIFWQFMIRGGNIGKLLVKVGGENRD